MLRTLTAAAALILASPAIAGEAPEWRAVDETTGQIRDVDGLEQLARDFPESGTVRLRMLQPLIAAGEAEKALETLAWLYDRGYVFSDVEQEQIPRLLEGVDPGRIAERLRAEAEVIEASEIVATVPAEAGLVESVFSPAGEDVFLATSITEQVLYVYGKTKEWHPVSIPGASDLSGIVSAPDNSVGFVASSNLDGSEQEQEFAGLIGLTGDLNGPLFIPAPEGAAVSDLSVGPYGTLFASDPIGGGIYVGHLEATELEALTEPGTFRSPQGSTVSEDASKLYVSDYRYGIAIVDLDTREVFRLASDIPVILDGVDGLWRYGNELIAVQNGTSPMRISAFELSDDGMRVIGHRVLEQAHHEWTEPLSGSIAGDALIYVGTGQWDRYIEGELKEGMEPLPTQIRGLPLTSTAE